jgi:hypothetical protein
MDGPQLRERKATPNQIGKVGSNRTVMLLNSVQQSLESDTLAPDYIDSDQKDLGFAMSELPEHVARIARTGMIWRSSTWRLANAHGQEEPTWGI